MNIAYNTDCLTAMREYPENYFDLAVCDPPYGDGRGGNPDRLGTNKVSRTGGTWAAKFGKKIIAWDVAPGKEYFEQLFRISRNQVIWGGNYLVSCKMNLNS